MNETAVGEIELVEHVVSVSAAPDEVYRLIADATSWPHFFEPTVLVDRVEGDAVNERLRLWAFANGEVRTWTSRRELDPPGFRVKFRQEVTSDPVASMGGEWIMTPAGDGTTRVTLKHDYSAVGGEPEKLDWIRRAVDHNSQSELGSVKSTVEQLAAGTGIVLSFADSVDIAGSARDVYDFLYRSDLWAERLPHVSRLALTEDTPGIQIMEMDTATPSGETHTTKSVRICFPHERIVYKQFIVPKILAAHTGQWTCNETEAGTRVTSRHTVVIASDAVKSVLGPDATVSLAADQVHAALSANSLSTLRIAKELVERNA